MAEPKPTSAPPLRPIQPGEAVPAVPPHATEGPPRPTVLRRLACAWGVLVALLATPLFAAGAVASYTLKPTSRSFGRWARGWARTLSIGAGCPVHADVRYAFDPAQPVVYVSNHQNAFDIPALILGLPHDIGFMAKAELRSVPALGHALRHSPSVFVDRRDARRAVKSMKEAGEQIRQGTAVAVFPEGARTYSNGLMPFMRGAFMMALEAGVPIVPVTILDSFRRLDERSFTLSPGHVHMIVDAPLSLEGKTRRDVPELMAEVERIMLANLATTHR